MIIEITFLHFGESLFSISLIDTGVLSSLELLKFIGTKGEMFINRIDIKNKMNFDNTLLYA